MSFCTTYFSIFTDKVVVIHTQKAYVRLQSTQFQHISTLNHFYPIFRLCEGVQGDDTVRNIWFVLPVPHAGYPNMQKSLYTLTGQFKNSPVPGTKAFLLPPFPLKRRLYASIAVSASSKSFIVVGFFILSEIFLLSLQYAFAASVSP